MIQVWLEIDSVPDAMYEFESYEELDTWLFKMHNSLKRTLRRGSVTVMDDPTFDPTKLPNWNKVEDV